MRTPALVSSALLALALALGCGGGLGGGSDASVSASALPYTQWSMEFSVGEDEYYTIDFLEDGTYLVDGEPGPENTWKVTGDTLYMTEEGYTYEAHFVDPWTVGGTVTQLEDGETWPFRMTRRK